MFLVVHQKLVFFDLFCDRCDFNQFCFDSLIIQFVFISLLHFEFRFHSKSGTRADILYIKHLFIQRTTPILSHKYTYKGIIQKIIYQQKLRHCYTQLIKRCYSYFLTQGKHKQNNYEIIGYHPLLQ
jgi:hypothetical protein